MTQSSFLEKKMNKVYIVFFADTEESEIGDNLVNGVFTSKSQAIDCFMDLVEEHGLEVDGEDYAHDEDCELVAWIQEEEVK